MPSVKQIKGGLYEKISTEILQFKQVSFVLSARETVHFDKEATDGRFIEGFPV